VLRVISFIRAMWWLVRFGESATHMQAGDRQAMCESCPSVQRTETGIYCGECGCPQWFYVGCPHEDEDRPSQVSDR
jgi:uncharacterized paraquat-inducible protein A